MLETAQMVAVDIEVKPKKNESDKYFDDITGEISQDKITKAYNQIAKKGRYENKEEFEKVFKIKERLAKMADHRKKSCPWYLSPVQVQRYYQDEDGQSQSAQGKIISHSGFDWSNRWKRDRDLWSMKSGKNRWDPELPESSSPIVYSPVQTALATFQDADTSAKFEPLPGCDPIIAKVAQAWLTNWENKTDIQQKFKNHCYQEALICGTAISYNSRAVRTRRVKMMRSVDEIMQEMQSTLSNVLPQELDSKVAELQNSIKNTSNLTRDEVITDFDDFMVERVPLHEFFIDPGAIEINWHSRDARDCIWLQYKTVQEVFQEFENSNDAFVLKKNLDFNLIKTAGEIAGEYVDVKNETWYSDIFYGDSDIDLCAVLRYYNKYTDQYIVIVNDIIVRDGPLPYNHKLLPFSKYVAIPLLDSFYGVGYGTLLDTLQSHDELIDSLQNYTAVYNANLPGTYSNESGEMESSLKEIMEGKRAFKAGEWIKINQGDTVNRLPPIQLGFELQNTKQDIQQRSVSITGVDPVTPFKMVNTAVRNNQMSKENTLLLLRMSTNNWAQGYADAITQGLQIVKQTEPASYEKIKEDTIQDNANPQLNKVFQEIRGRKYKQIKTPGVEIIKDDAGDYIEKENPLKDGLLELKPELTDSFDKLKVNISIETSALASQQLKIQDLNETLNLAMTVMGNPVFSENKIVMGLFKQFLEKKNTDPKILSYFEDENSEESDIVAEYQNTQMLDGVPMSPISGMSESHIQLHVSEMLKLVMEREQLVQNMKPINEAINNPTSDPLLLESAYTQAQSMQAEIDRLTDLIFIFNQHIAGDMAPKDKSAQAALAMAQPSATPQDPLANQGPEIPPGGVSEPSQPAEMPMAPVSGI